MTPEQIKTRLIEKMKMDPERLKVTGSPTLLATVISVGALTEEEQRAIQGGLHQDMKGKPFRVERHEVEGKPPAYDLEKLKTMLEQLGKSPDSQLDKIFTKRIREMPEDIELDEMLEFLRNLRDECVFGAGASGFVMTLFSCLLDDYPEPQETMDARRAILEKKYGMA